MIPVVARGNTRDGGNCISCHTRDGGEPSPAVLHRGHRSAIRATIYSTNITPDVDTGIGKYTRPT